MRSSTSPPLFQETISCFLVTLLVEKQDTSDYEETKRVEDAFEWRWIRETAATEEEETAANNLGQQLFLWLRSCRLLDRMVFLFCFFSVRVTISIVSSHSIWSRLDGPSHVQTTENS